MSMRFPPLLAVALALERFAFALPPQGEGYPALMTAHARALDRLADHIAARITGAPAA